MRKVLNKLWAPIEIIMSMISAITFEVQGVLLFTAIFVVFRVLSSPVAAYMDAFYNFMFNIFVLFAMIVFMFLHALWDARFNNPQNGLHSKFSYYKTRILVNILIFLLCGYLWKNCHPRHHSRHHIEYQGAGYSLHNSKYFPEPVFEVYHMILSAASAVSLIRTVLAAFDYASS